MSFNEEYMKLRKKRLEEEQKKQKSAPFVFESGPYQNATLTADDIAPVKSQNTVVIDDARDIGKKNNRSGLFKAGAFADGYQFGDVTKVILGTAGDVASGLVQGVAGIGEGLGDLAMYGVAGVQDLVGNDDDADRLRDATKDEVIAPLFDSLRKKTNIDDTSLLGDFGYGIAQGVGQVGAIIATGGAGSAAGLGTVGTSALTTGMIGASSMGSGMSEAYQGGATDKEALGYGAMKGVIDAGTEMIFGGLGKSVKALGVSKGLTSIDDVFAKKLSSKMSSQFFKNATEYGVKATAEGLEEVLAGLGSAAAKKLTYMSDEELSQLVEDENLLEQFAAGALVSGIAQGGDLVKSTKQGRDYITNFSGNEETVIEKVYNDRVAEAEQDGKKLTNKEKNKLYEQVQADMRKGYISTDDIESVLGGETYKSYKDTIDSEDAILKEFDELGKKQNATLAEQSRYAELQEKVKEIKSNSNRNNLKSKLSEEVYNSVKEKDFYLAESYNERARRGTAFEADLSQYDEKTAETVKRAIDSGILNNTRRTHEFVDMVAKISADKGVLFDFTNNQKLKESGFAVDGASINGYVTKDGITVNISSAKATNSIVGHEITHVLEGTELYAEMQSALFEYAKSKNDYDGRRKSLEELYKNVEDADIDAELTADLVGDYLFTDEDFINNLSTKHRNVFQKIYDEIKYLCKIATAGSKEARELEKVKRAFDKAYRANGNASGDTKYSLSDSDGKKLTKEQSEYFKDSKMRDENGNLKVMYHGSQDAGFHVFDAKMSDDDTSFFFVDSNDVAASYSGTSETYEAQTIRTAEDMNNFIESIGVDGYEVVEKDGKFTLLYEGDRIADSDTVKGIYEEFCWYEGVGEGDANYKVYLNLTNPLQVDAKNSEWNDIPIPKEHLKGINESWDNPDPYGWFYKATTRQISEYAKAQGFDGVIFKNIVDVGGYGNGSEGASTVAVAFESNQIKSVANEKPTANADIRYSLSSDSEGRELSAEQREYFKDSKIVDDNGSLKVMHHGSPETFTVFDKKKAKSSGTYGKGFYFTDSTSHAATYGKAYDVYLNITNPLQNGTNDITKDQIRKFVEAIAEDEDYGIDNYGYDATIDSVTDSVYGKSDFGMIMDLNISCVGNMVEAIELFNKVNGTNYNGIVAPTETVAFYPEQIKNIDNKAPTSNPDIRFSLSNPQTDKDYLNAVERGDMETAQKIVDDTAKATMPNSKIVNSDGTLKKVYHGSPSEFNIFDYEKIGSIGHQEGFGFYFADTETITKHYGNSRAFYLDIQKPMYSDRQTITRQELKRFIKAIDPDGNGVISGYEDAGYIGYETALQRTVSTIMEYNDNDQDIIYEVANADGWNYTAKDFLEFARILKDTIGYDGLISKWEVGDVYVVFDNKQMKLSDTVTYDNNGKIIPLSERFNAQTDDIRYSLSKEGETPKRYGNYNIFGDDIRLEAPTQEEVAPESEVVAKNAIPTEDVAPIAEDAEVKPIPQTKNRTHSKAALARFTKKKTYSGGFSFQGGYNADGKQYLSDGNFAVEFNDIDESIPHNKDFPIKKLQSLLNDVFDGQSTEKYNIDFDKIVEINKSNKGNKAIVTVGGTPFDAKYVEAVMRAIPNATFALSDYRGGIKTLVAVGDNGRAMLMPVRAGNKLDVAYTAQEIKPTLETIAPMPNEPTIYDLEQKQAELEDIIRKAMENNDPNAPKLIDEYGELLDSIAKRKAEESTMESERLASLVDADVPPEMEAPYYDESADTAPENPFEDRDIKAVGNRKVKAYMYENPEVKPFFQEEANILLGELRDGTKGERWFNDQLYYDTNGEKGFGGTKRHVSADIEYLLDTLNLSYAEIEKGLNAIIEDHGEENNAASKRIEFILNDRLLKGYTEFTNGYDVPPNQDYINLIKEKQITEYSEEARAKFFEEADKYAPPVEDIAPIAENTTVNEPKIDEPIVDAPIAEAYEAIKPKKEKTTEPRLKRVKEGEQSPNGKERKWVGTSTESEAVDGKILPDDLDQEAIHYQPISNKKTLDTANAKLDGMGYESSLAYFNSQFANKKTTVEDIVLGERLIQEAIKRGDTKTAGELIEDVAILGTELGQKVQALSIIKRLTPEGQLRMLQRTVERGKTREDKAYEGVEITQEMIDKILKAYNEDGSFDQTKLNEAVEDAKQKIADQMKVSKMDKVNAWRYLSMLGNPKTHIRNLVSNVAMRGTTAVKNVVARTIETVAPLENRTKTWKKASDEVKAFSQKTAAEMQDVLSDGGKYNEDASIKQKRAIFKNKILNGVYEFNSDMLSKEDWWFSKPAFTNALSEYLTANGINTAQDIENNPKIVAKAKKYATEQSQIATFRQYSWLANKINEIEHKNVATEIAIGAVLPFKKTPINIAKTALNYSPLGFAKTLTYDASQVKNGKMEASELVDHLAQNVTGSALVLIGYMLANAGFLNGAGEDDKEGKYDYQLGEQAYSINIGNATFSLSWLSPIAMPLFVGANAYEQLVEGKEWNGNVVVETLAQTLDPLSEMSFLSSLDSVLSSYDSGIEKFAGIAQSAAQSYTTQFVPTLSSQVAAVMDDTKRSTKVAADSDFKFVDETVNKLKYKIPFLRETLEPSTDIWGNDVKQTEDFMERAFETFIAPYAKKKDISSGVDEEIKALYGETGDAGLIPSIPYNYINYDGKKYEMSASEYTEYKKLYGQNAYELMSDLFNTSTYKAASSEERADMVNRIYDFARDEAKREYFAKYGIEFTNATKDGEEYYKENSIKGAIEYDMTPDEYEFVTENPEKYKFFEDVGLSYEEYKNGSEDFKDAYSWAFKNPEKFTVSKAVASDVVTYRKYASDLYDIKADKDEDGKSISGSRKEKVIDYVNNLDIDYGARLILFKSEYNADDTYNYDIIDYLNNRQDISYEEMETILKELGFIVRSDGTIQWD